MTPASQRTERLDLAGLRWVRHAAHDLAGLDDTVILTAIADAWARRSPRPWHDAVDELRAADPREEHPRMTDFPKDKDLPAGSLMAVTVLEAETVDTEPASAIGASIKDLRMRHAHPCDMVIMCVAPGAGKPFVEGLMQSMGSDPTAIIDPTNE